VVFTLLLGIGDIVFLWMDNMKHRGLS